MNATFNDKLQAATLEVKDPTDTSKKIFDKEYQYYTDGSLKYIKENLDPTLKKQDRLYTYDFAERLTEARSGTEASGTTQTNLMFLPYRQAYTYDSFSHKTERASTLWTVEDWNFSNSFVNNRASGWTYDSTGHPTSADGVDYAFDASGRMISNSKTSHFELSISAGGDGSEGRRASRKWNSSSGSWDAWATSYFITSSVLGETVSETDGTGKKSRTFVFANGSTLARQVVDESNNESVSWEYSDASGQSIRMIGSDGTGTGADAGGGELDGLGNNVGTHGSSSDPRNSDGETSPYDRKPISEEVPCVRNGLAGPCSIVEMFARDGGWTGDFSAAGTFASIGSTMPVQYDSHNHRTGHNSGNRLTEQFYLNSLGNWIDSGSWAATPGRDTATVSYGDTETSVVTITANPSTLQWIPKGGLAAGGNVSAATGEPYQTPSCDITAKGGDTDSLNSKFTPGLTQIPKTLGLLDFGNKQGIMVEISGHISGDPKKTHLTQSASTVQKLKGIFQGKVISDNRTSKDPVDDPEPFARQIGPNNEFYWIDIPGINRKWDIVSGTSAQKFTSTVRNGKTSCSVKWHVNLTIANRKVVSHSFGLGW